MPHILITGANRGIGFELTRQLIARGDTVTAIVRHRSAALDTLGCQVIDGVDLTDSTSRQYAKTQLAGQPFDALFNVAGLLTDESLGAFDDAAAERIRTQFEINAVVPLQLSALFGDQLASPGKLIMLTSRMGSIADNSSGGRYGYRMSKAALNAAAKSLAIDLRERGIAVGVFHPGWVQTDMTGHSGHLTAAESARLLLARYDELTLETSGVFVHANGEELPW